MLATTNDRCTEVAVPVKPISKHRVLFVGEAVSLAHVGRPAILARWTREGGYDVRFACGHAFSSVARAEGFAPIELWTIDAVAFYARLNAQSFFYTAEELERYVRAEMDLIEEFQPDLIVGDFRLTLDISTTLSGIPLVSLNNAHWSPAAACRFAAPHAGLFRLFPASLRDSLFALIRPRIFRTFAKPLDLVRQRFGLNPLRDFREHYTAGNHCAYLDLPGFTPIEKLPAGHFFLGPVAWKPPHTLSPSLGNLGTQRLLVYVTLGSSGDAGVLPTVLSALLKSDCDIAISSVSSEQSDAIFRAMPELHGRCVAAPMFDPNEILARASVTVCHGGSGSVYQSLAAGVPLVCLPGNPDQNLIATAARNHGAATVVESHRATRARLSGALTAVLADAHFAESALRLAHVIAQHDSHRTWMDFLNRVLPIPSAQTQTSAARTRRTQPC